MFRRFPSWVAATMGGLLLVALTGCDGTGPTEVRSIHASPSFAMHADRAEPQRSLASLKGATARFHRLEAAQAEGWAVQLTPCLENPVGEGAMGFHYGNPALLDGIVDAAKPEVLVYAPWRDGQLRLVAVEYIVPMAAWSDEEPPELFGHHFHEIPGEPLFGLHAWVWHHNPDGMFADWNPRLSCDENPVS